MYNKSLTNLIAIFHQAVPSLQIPSTQAFPFRGQDDRLHAQGYYGAEKLERALILAEVV